MHPSHNKMRREFMRFGLTAMACSVVTPALAMVPSIRGFRTLAFHNLHTDEKLHIDYWRDGSYDRGALGKINHILRDHYSGDERQMDIRLIDLVHDLRAKLGNENAIEIISGYRSPATNMHLARMSDGVARNSFHMRGMAMDLRMTGNSLPKIHQTALNMRRGGVGYYPDSQFVHVDVGPLRAWG